MSSALTKRPFVPDDEQSAVINAATDDFLLVTAPPGAGKTAVACARIVELTRRGVEAANIMMLSFTRVAVREFRDRIQAIAKDDADVNGVEITTLDSSAWWILKGIDEESKIEDLFGDYDNNIERVLHYLREGNPTLLDYLSRFRHLLVDEAQDLTASRADLVMRLIRFLREQGVGVTVFADPAQAIYGFTCTDEGERVADRSLFFLQMLDQSDLQPRQLSLSKIHRTQSESLNRLFLTARDPLQDGCREAPAAYQETRAVIEANVDGVLDGYLNEHPEVYGDDSRLILYRTRWEVLKDSSFLSSTGAGHRLRLSGYPHVVEPWVGVTLGRWTEPYMSEDDFHESWREHAECEALELGGRTPHEAWEILRRLRVFERGRIKLRALRRLLSRKRPPLEIVSPAIGCRGPILGTIHAAKGTEARTVTLMLPRAPQEDADTDHHEEARVLYVGATRAVESLNTGQGTSGKCGVLEGSGRSWRGVDTNKGAAQVEFGRDGDLDLLSPVARDMFATGVDAEHNQVRLADMACSAIPLVAKANAKKDWRFELSPSYAEASPVACFTKNVNSDLFRIPEAMGKPLNPPTIIKHLYSVGCTTVCIPEDDARLDELHEPFSESGIFLAPVVKGLAKVFFRTRRKKA